VLGNNCCLDDESVHSRDSKSFFSESQGLFSLNGFLHLFSNILPHLQNHEDERREQQWEESLFDTLNLLAHLRESLIGTSEEAARHKRTFRFSSTW